MKRHQQTSRRVRSVATTILLTLAAIVISGCTAPYPVYLHPQDVTVSPQKAKNLEVAVIVEDTRPAPIRTVRMIGPMRGGYNNVAGFAFLSNFETFDIILARHMKDRLESAGYTVVSTYPEIPEDLTGESQQLDKKAFTSAEQKSARKMEDTVIQSDGVPKSEAEAKAQFEKIKAQEGAVDLESMPTWSASIEVPKADAVVYARVGALYADNFMIWPGAVLETYVGAMAANVSVWSKNGTEYGPRLTRSLNSSSFTADPWPFPRLTNAHSLMINESFTKMLDQFETLAYSTELTKAIKSR